MNDINSNPLEYPAETTMAIFVAYYCNIKMERIYEYQFIKIPEK